MRLSTILTILLILGTNLFTTGFPGCDVKGVEKPEIEGAKYCAVYNSKEDRVACAEYCHLFFKDAQTTVKKTKGKKPKVISTTTKEQLISACKGGQASYLWVEGNDYNYAKSLCYKESPKRAKEAKADADQILKACLLGVDGETYRKSKSSSGTSGGPGDVEGGN